MAYGRKGLEKIAMQAEQDANANSYSKANAVKRTVSKSSHLYKNKTWDLVDAMEQEEVVVANLKEESLPKELQGKSEEDIKTYVEKKSKERANIQKEIKALNAKRKAYVLKQQKENINGLENAMIKAIKEQAKKKKYSFQ